MYVRVKQGGMEATSEKPKTLVGGQLKAPQGLAVDVPRSKLYVADPDLKQIKAYRLYSSGDYLAASDANVAIDNVESRWVAVDSGGHVYATDEGKNLVLKQSLQNMAAGNTTADVIYDGKTVSGVSAPGGIAVDSYYTYWANKATGMKAGSVVKGKTAPELATLQTAWTPIASNSDKTYGVCMATNSIFYTQPDAVLYGVKKRGGTPAVVSDRLTNPRGCAWDGDGTVYVADRGANAVFSFAGNMQTIGAAMVQRAVSVDDAFGVAVFSGGSQRHRALGTFALALVALQIFAGFALSPRGA